MLKFQRVITLAGILSFFWLQWLPLVEARFTVAPAPPDERQFSFELSPGEQKKSSLIIDNLSNEVVSFSFYSADATQSSQGTFALTTLDTPQKNIGQWVTFEKSTVTLQAEETREISFTVKIPSDIPPGMYGGGIAVQEIPLSTDAEKASAVAVSSRMVVKLFVTVPGDKEFNPNWENFSYTLIAGKNNDENKVEKTSIQFDLEYKNNGNTITIIEQKIEIEGNFINIFGHEKETITLPAVTLLQGESVHIPVAWKSPPLFGLIKAGAIATFYEFDSIKNGKINPVTYYKEISMNFISWHQVAMAGIVIVLIIVCCIIFFKKNEQN